MPSRQPANRLADGSRIDWKDDGSAEFINLMFTYVRIISQKNTKKLRCVPKNNPTIWIFHLL